jgi:hypothetical protein
MTACFADNPKAENEKRSIWNPLRGGGRGKLWAEDAKANIEYLEFKLNAIKVRNEVATNARQDGGKEWGKEAPGSLGINRRGPLLRTLEILWSSAKLGRVGLSATNTEKERESLLTQDEIDNTCRSVSSLLKRARDAATGARPAYRPFWSWWSGTGTEAAYKNQHYAEAAIARLYNSEEVCAEIPDAVRRAKAALADDNPTRAIADSLMDGNKVVGVCTPEQLSVIVALGHEAADRNRAKLRTFRNVLMFGALIMTLLLAGLVALAAYKASLIPLCFTQVPPPETPAPATACPTGEGLSVLQGMTEPKAPTGGDVFIVAVMGVIGGALSSAVFVRGMSSNPTPYNVAIPLALLKIPVGGLAAIVGIVLLAGDFVPGFSAIDKQVQILAYALVFGFAQQVFTSALDQRGETLIASLPTKNRAEDVVLPSKKVHYSS